MANPVVTPALLVKVNLATEQAWPTNQAEIENKDVDAGTLDALLSHEQSASDNLITKITDTSKDYDVNVLWYDFCGSTAIDCAQDPCGVITGNGNEIKGKSYTIASCIEDSFEVSESLFATISSTVEEYIMKRQNRMIKNMLEKLNAKAIAFLAANAGYNRGGSYPYAAGVTSVPDADYNSTALMTRMLYDTQMSKIKNAFAIDGGSLFVPFTNAMLNAGNGEGKGNAARTKLFDVNYDLIGMAAANLVDTTFLVSPHAYAFVSKNYVKNRVPTEDTALTGSKMKYSIPIPAYGITIDVWHQRVCEDGAKDRFKHVFLYKVHYDFLLNPSGCDLGGGIVTGIAEYKKVA